MCICVCILSVCVGMCFMCIAVCVHTLHTCMQTLQVHMYVVARHATRVLCHHRKYIGQIYTDSLVHDENALKFLASTIGEVSFLMTKSPHKKTEMYTNTLVYVSLFYFQDRIVLGSDYPFPLGEQHPGKIISSVTEWEGEMKVRLSAALAVL